VNYYYSTDGVEVQGPCVLSDLVNQFSSGALPEATQVCAEGTQNWQTLASLADRAMATTMRITRDIPGPRTIPQPVATAEHSESYAVKVLTAKDPAFAGKLDPEKLEAVLNSYAAQGWSVAGCDSAHFSGFLGAARSGLITVMHRIPGPMKKYKILTQKDRFFGGRFDPEKLEGAINSYVPEGWQVCAVTRATFPGSGSAREEMIVILEKEA
jgi:hypothetical protein